MTLRDLVGSFRKHVLIIILAVVTATGAAGVLSYLADPVYRSSSSLHFSLDFGRSASDLNQGQAYTQSQMLTFAQLATLPVVLDPVIEELGLGTSAQQLAGSVTATRPQDGAILEIAVTSGDPEWAAQVANAVAVQLGAVAEDIAPRDENGRTSVRVLVVKEAQVPTYAIAPSTRRNLVLGFVVGLLAGLTLAYLRDLLDTRVRTEEDVRDLVGVPVLGQIGRASSRVLQAGEASSGTRAEEYRRLRTNLRFLDLDNAGLQLVISSAMPGEGKTTTCANLAITLAEADMRVLVIDADLRRPRLADAMGLENNAGLTTVLIGRAAFEDVVQPWGTRSLDVLAAGEVPPNPSELLSSRGLHRLMDDLRDRYDVILIDAPPLLPVADAAILSRLATGVVVVGDTRKVRRAQLREVVNGVRTAGGSVVGVVLNRVRTRKQAYGYESYASHARHKEDLEPLPLVVPDPVETEGPREDPAVPVVPTGTMPSPSGARDDVMVPAGEDQDVDGGSTSATGEVRGDTLPTQGGAAGEPTGDSTERSPEESTVGRPGHS